MWMPTTARADRPRQTALSERPDRCGMGAYPEKADPDRARSPAARKRRVAIREVINGVMYDSVQHQALPVATQNMPKDLAAQISLPCID